MGSFAVPSVTRITVPSILVFQEEVMGTERVLLQTIKFDLHVDLPYTFLLQYQRVTKVYPAVLCGIQLQEDCSSFQKCYERCKRQ